MTTTLNLAGKKILVTGGAGFIGSHLVELLVAAKAFVVVVDIQMIPNSYFVLQNLKKDVRYYQVDVLEKDKLFDIIKTENIEYIFHLAAQTLVTEAFKEPYATLLVNIMGTVNILEAGRTMPAIKGIVVASSDKAYGKTKSTYSEMSPLQGDHPYDVSKSCADLICQTYHKTYGVPVAISRFGNVYGEGDVHLDRIIPGICEAIIKNKTLIVRSNGKYIRDYLYVKDVAKGYLLLLEQITKTGGEAYNFSSKDTFSVVELIGKAEEILGLKIPYTISNTAQNEIPYQHLNDLKVRKLGWRPDQDLNSTLRVVLSWYKLSL